MATPLVPDELWKIIEPLLPPERARPNGVMKASRRRAIGSRVMWDRKSKLDD